jgi:hypothetical protein
MSGEGTGKRYIIKGENITKFLNKYGTFLTMGARKSKQWQKKK